MSASPRLSIASHVVWNDVDGDLVVFDPDDDRYHALNEVASSVWRGIAQGRTLPDIIGDLRERYAHDPAEIDAAVRHFVDEAIAHGLLHSITGDA